MLFSILSQLVSSLNLNWSQCLLLLMSKSLVKSQDQEEIDAEVQVLSTLSRG